jgi:hypothetical protein
MARFSRPANRRRSGFPRHGIGLVRILPSIHQVEHCSRRKRHDCRGRGEPVAPDREGEKDDGIPRRAYESQASVRARIAPGHGSALPAHQIPPDRA